MPRIVLARERQHEQIEFPDDVSAPESRRGGRKTSLHLCRGSVRDVTEAELAHIKDRHPDVFRCLDVLPDPRYSPALVRKVKEISAEKARKKRAEAEETAKAAKTTKASKGGRKG